MARGEERLAGVGYCFHPNTDIITNKGFTKISDIKIGDMVLTSIGYKKVINLFSREVKENLIGITTYGGSTKPVYLTCEHEVKTVKIKSCKYHKIENLKKTPCKPGMNFCSSVKCKDYEDLNISWVKARDLKEGYYLTKPKLKDFCTINYEINFKKYIEQLALMKIDENFYYTNFLKDKLRRGKKARFPSIIQNSDFWFTVGLWIAEGNLKFSSCSKNRSVIGLDFCFNIKETYLSDWVLNTFGEGSSKVVDNTIRVHIRNKIIGHAFYDNFGSASLKRLPEGLSKHQFLKLLSGWIQGDGHLSKETLNLTIASCYKDLLNSLIKYLEYFSIDYSLSQHDIKGCYNLRILASSSHLIEVIDYKQVSLSNSKTISNFELDSHRCFKIRKLDYIYYEGLVYDFEVEDIHEYCTSNFIAHNSALNPELQGVDPNDYSLVWRNKILTDVARGSKEHRETREEALQAYKQGDLSKREIEILGNTLDQEQQLTQKKEFYEKPNTGFTGPIGMFQSLMWETMRRNAESPLEMLTPIRPAAKFLHQRTAIEDYIETQLGGSDAGIWTNPYSHFIKPALNKSRQSLPLGNEVFIPDEAREKYNIDEYFDKLDYLRKRKSGSNDYALSTVIGASLSGLNTKEKVLKFKAGLSDDQKDYFDSFSKETNEGKRDLIRTILPEDVRRGYEQIWQNLDIANKTRQNGGSVQEAIYNNLHKQTKRLQDTYDVDLTKEEKTKARKIVSQDKDTYSQMGMSKSERIQATEDELLRFKMADKESLTYIKQRTGVPNKNFIGWDPRLQTDDIKIRTLTLGGEDLKRFGFWKKDEERLRSLSAITEESDAVFSQINAIKADMKSNRNLKRSIERTMFENGFKSTNITFVPNDYGSLLVRENS